MDDAAPERVGAGAPLHAERLEALSANDIVPDDVREIMKRIDQAGFDVWLVGGALRDFFLARRMKDWDLATSATPEQVMALFPKVVPVGIRFGTVSVHTHWRDVEVTSCSSPGIEGVLADLNRRDFTINALALSFPDGRLLDPHDGLGDLAAGVVRGVGNARRRFREDPLRILRAFRFMSVLSFRIARGTVEAMKIESPALESVSIERIRDEMLKIIMGRNLVACFELMRRTGIFRMLLPELESGCRKRRGAADGWDVCHHTMYAIRSSPERVRVRLGILFHNIAEPMMRKRARGRRVHRDVRKESSVIASEVMWRWRMPRKLIHEVSLMVENQLPVQINPLSDADLRRWMGRLGSELLPDVLDMEEAKRFLRRSGVDCAKDLRDLRVRVARIMETKPPMGIRDLAIKGEDVMKLSGCGPGPQVGEILQALYERVMEDPGLNHPDRLAELVKRGGAAERYGHFHGK